MKLDGAVVWVVGGSSGIGAATARELVSRGATVAVSARRERELQDVSRGDMLVVPVDVTDAEAMAAAAARVRREAGPIDLLLYCAAMWQQMTAAQWDADAFDRHLQVNLGGMSNALAAVLPDMVERGAGNIAGISSVAGFRGIAGSGAYGATKAAQLNLLESLRIELSPAGIGVIAICPGFVRTDLTASNRFRMPFMIEAPAAAMAICNGLERGRVQLIFPLPVAVLSRAARFVPPRAWAALWRRRKKGSMTMRIHRTITVAKPVDAVFDYLSDFTTTTQWDPGTVRTERSVGDGGPGTVYLNTSRFLGRTTQLRYVVEEVVRDAGAPRRIRLRGENDSVVAHDTIECAAVANGARVDYTAEFEFTGFGRIVAPLLRPALRRLGERAEAGMRAALADLPAG